MGTCLVNLIKPVFKLRNKYSFGDLFYSGLVYDVLCDLPEQPVDKTDTGTHDQIWKVLKLSSAKEMHMKLFVALQCFVL